MPSLAEIKQKRLKKFIKKPYRIWDLTGEKNSFESKHTQIKDEILLPDNKSTNSSVSPQHLLSFLDIDDTHTRINNQTTERQQRDNRETTERQQRDNRETTERQQRDNRETTERQQSDNGSDNNQTTIRQQPVGSYSCVPTEEEFVSLIKSLSGLQEKFFYLMLEYCNFNNDLQTGQLKTTKVSSFIGCGYSCTKTTMERIVKKGLIKRLKGKGSIAGFVQFEMIKEIKIIGNRLELQKKSVDIDFKKFILEIRQQIRQQLDNSLDNNEYSSSSSIYKETTTKEIASSNKPQQLSTEWHILDIEPLAMIGFTKTHLSQIASQNKLTTQIVQDSIYAFAFDLQKNDKAKSIKGDPINFFMGILRNGRVYTFPSNYESPQDKAMRLYRESKLKIEQGRVEAEKEAISLAFNEWFAKLTDEEKKEFLPELFRNNTNSEKLGKSKILESSARNYFEKEIWPDKKNEIIGEIKKVEEQEVSERK